MATKRNTSPSNGRDEKSRKVTETGKFSIGGKPQPSLGAPSGSKPKSQTYVTEGKVVVISDVEDVADPVVELQALAAKLDSQRGVLFSSSYEYPGRYAQWSMGFSNPPIVLETWSRRFQVRALNRRGVQFLPMLIETVKAMDDVEKVEFAADRIDGSVKQATGFFSEEERSKQPSVFSVIRGIVRLFASDEDPHLGLYGAFGYDLAFQFEPIKFHKKRDEDQRDIVLYIPDEVLIVNHQSRSAWRMRYDFVFMADGGMAPTKGIDRDGLEEPFQPRQEMPAGIDKRDLAPGEFAKQVDVAKKKFACGDLFEAVLSQTFREPCKSSPSSLFRCLQHRNPSPYGFLINLGQKEWLVGASPEMFVRVEDNLQGKRVETCPISGTIRRGRNALEDAENIVKILSDPKEESEITMCTDVDRNDKSRICEHGTVQVIGRRQIEMYSRLIHTVDHVEGYLRPEFDAIDAFLCQMWAVTVCGAPKTWAMQFVEEMEKSQRRWYGASVGHIAFDGHLNTGLTLRTIRVHDGVAEVRAGATLLFDSVPESEEAETELKASACINAVRDPSLGPVQTAGAALAQPGKEVGFGKHVLLIDFEDSFVHTLANYIRQTGAQVTTVRHSRAEVALESMAKPDLAVLSPGPGNPKSFGVTNHIKRLLDAKIPIFGVCLGLQSIVEHFGGELNQLSYPQHGKPGLVKVTEGPGGIFESLPAEVKVGRYHSLYAKRPLPDCLKETARMAGDAEDTIMGVQHSSLPVAGVQFHPESILTSPDMGVRMLSNALEMAQKANGKR